MSLRGAGFLAYVSEQAPQTQWVYEIATPRQVGARNDTWEMVRNDDSPLVVARHGSAEAISWWGRGLPRSRLPSLGGQVARNDKKRGKE